MKNFDLTGLQEIPVSKEVMLRIFSSLPLDAIYDAHHQEQEFSCGTSTETD
ncbi:MAG: hypothetical protein WAW35_00590 [Sideroxyarcus sp.]